VNRIDQETEKEARAHKGCRAIQEEHKLIFENKVPRKIFGPWRDKINRIWGYEIDVMWNFMTYSAH
jgi:hypothetical protein